MVGTPLAEVPAAGYARLGVYTLSGIQAATIEIGHLDRGRRILRWNGRDTAGRPLARRGPK